MKAQWLLDVNVLMALVDPSHVHNAKARQWFRTYADQGWATCTITENGFVRVASSTGYPNSRLTPASATGLLNALKASFKPWHHFWADDTPLTNPERFDMEQLAGSKQTTDAYLAGLAFGNGGRLVTFDGGIPWRAVRGATAELVERIAR